jgi:hypothetical protein
VWIIGTFIYYHNIRLIWSFIIYKSYQKKISQNILNIIVDEVFSDAHRLIIVLDIIQIFDLDGKQSLWFCYNLNTHFKKSITDNFEGGGWTNIE